MIINKYNVVRTLKENGVKVRVLYPIGVKHFELLEDLKIRLSNDNVIEIKAGFKFDGSSSPKLLWSIFPSYGDFFFAALIHDWMYINDYERGVLGLKKAQKFADKEMLFWSDLINRDKKSRMLDNKLRYYAVRLFGKKVYIR